MEKFTNSTNDFAFTLFKHLAKDDQTTVNVLSPASILSALSMAYVGSDGNTKEQMNHLLFNGLNDEEINENMQIVMKTLTEPNEGYALKIANRTYVEKSYDILQEFLDIVRKYYHSDCVSCDFIKDSESAAQEINKWVEQATCDKIRQLIQPGILNSMTRLVLVNAVYFKGDWAVAFEEENTRKVPFFVTTDQQVEVDMMHMKMKEFLYNQNDKCQILGIPYKSKNLAMYFLLPFERNGLGKLVQELNGQDLVSLFQNSFRGCDVTVDLPKFKLESSVCLNDTFSQLGCGDMFDNKGNFSKISGKNELYVSAIIHKAFVEVNETGTEAAAASAVDMELRCAVEEFTFKADHPFLFAIFERETKTILFLGQYNGL